MTYQVLARKWRPQAFDALIGQQAVVTALTNALREGRVAQAYLFSGIRGVGKTTAARLFAKALNCEKGPAAGPCNDCATCRDITRGADLDVLEIDAATYSKVEQVRELAESLQYGPTNDRYKVVVLDEVHRLSRQAFDALLKIVEEPPPRLVFIFATTEVDAVPATILSRCQEFHFRRVPAADVAAHLTEIAAAESVTASPRALRLLARAGEGSVRDSVALLDQLATFGNGTIEEAEAARLVGGLDLALFGELLAAILAGDAPRVSALAREVESQGWDPRQVHAHFLAYCRDALHLALGGKPAELDLPADDSATLAALVADNEYEDLLRLLHHLLASESAVRRSDAAALALELAWLRAAELPKLLAVEAMLAGGEAGAAVRKTKSAPGTEPARRRAAAAPPAVAATETSAAASQPAPPTPAPVPPPLRRENDDTTAAAIDRFRDELSARRPTLAAGLEHARLRVEDGQLVIELPGDDPLRAKQLGRASNRELLGAAAVAAFGAGTRLRLVEAPASSPSASAGEEESPTRSPEMDSADPALDDPRVQAVLDIFGGRAVTVEPADDEEGA